MARRLSIARSNETKFAEGTQTEFLSCRDLGHRWVSTTVEQDGLSYIETLGCDRCDAAKRTRIDLYGYRMGGGEHRLYPDGYLANGIGLSHRDGRAAVRVERMKRSIQGGKVKVQNRGVS